MECPDLTQAKVGDKVWDLLCHRWGEIIEIDKGHWYPIKIKFFVDDDRCSFRGFSSIDHAIPTIYFDEFTITPSGSALRPPKQKEKR